MGRPVSVRFDDELLARLEELRRRTGSSASGLIQRLVDEGLRQMDHPGIVFRPGPTGRRAGLAQGPDVAEVVTVVLEAQDRGPAAIAYAADALTLSVTQVSIGMRYYAAFTTEIDDEIRRRREESDRAYEEWRAMQRMLQ